METSFHPSLTLVPSLANYSLSLYTPPSLGSPSFTKPFPSFHGKHMQVGQEGGYELSIQGSILKFILI